MFLVLDFQFKIIRANLKLLNQVRKCYISPNNISNNIIHIIFTRFLLEFHPNSSFNLLLYKQI